MHRSTKILALGAIAVLFGSSCDPDQSAEAVADGAHRLAEAQGQVEQKRLDEKASQQQRFAGCMAECATPDTLPTDRETCRLNCRTNVGLPPASEDVTPADAILTRFDTCSDACAEPTPGNRATCRLECAESAPRKSPGDEVSKACASACLEDLVTCEGACTGAADDRSTCRLHCETAVNRCLPACGPAS